METLAQHDFGKAVLVLLALGFAAYALWRFVQAYAERGEESGEQGEAKKWGKRAGYLGRGLIYAGLTASTVKILLGSGGQQSQNQKGPEHDGDRVRLARRALDRRDRRSVHHRRRPLECLSRPHQEVRGQVAEPVR